MRLHLYSAGTLFRNCALPMCDLADLFSRTHIGAIAAAVRSFKYPNLHAASRMLCNIFNDEVIAT